MSNLVYSNLIRIARMSAVWCGLLAWRWTADRLGCMGCILFILPLWGTLMLASTEIALCRRHAFISQYLSTEGILARLLRGKTLLLVWQGIKALFFTLILLVSVLLFDAEQWLVLLIDILLMTVLMGLFTGLLRGEVKSGYREPMAHHWAHWVNALLLWLVSVLVMFFSAHVDYTGMAWDEVVHYSAQSVLVACDAIAVLARIGAVGEALAWWAAQNFLVALERPMHIVVAWLAFLAMFGLSFLSAWAYSRALAGVLSNPWRVATLPGLSTQER